MKHKLYQLRHAYKENAVMRSICVLTGVVAAIGLFAFLHQPQKAVVLTPTQKLVSTVKLPKKADKSVKITTASASGYMVKTASVGNVDQAVTFQDAKGGISFATVTNQTLGEPNLASASAKDNQTIYKNIYNGVDLIYTRLPGKLLEEYEVKTKRKIDDFVQKVDLLNVDYKQNKDGSYSFFKKDTGEFAFAVPKPVMYEKNNTRERSYALHYELVTENGHTFLVKHIDDAGTQWLEKANYPVMIDGTVSTTALTLESYPVSLGHWQVRLDTVDSGDLSFSVSPSATFESLTCGTQAVQTTNSNNTYSVSNFSCADAAVATYSLTQAGTYTFNATFAGVTQSVSTTYNPGAGPVFISENQDPIYVQPGQTITVTAHLTDNDGVQTVRASLDRTLPTIDMHLTSGTTQDGTWEGQWVAVGTGPIQYTTVITATNVHGVSTQGDPIVWSDWSNTGGGDHGGADWTIANGTAIAGVHTNVGILTIASGSTVTVQAYDGSSFGTVSISATSVSIGGTLAADGKGYLGGTNGGNGSGPGGGGGVGVACTAGAAAGGAHGGTGGSNTNASGGYPYDSFTAPTQMGSGGGSGGTSGTCTTGGAGGGAIRIISAGAFSFTGNITAKSVNTGSTGGAGAGGSIYVTTDSLSGTGTFNADGVSSASSGAGGGGGRIAVYYNTSTWTGTTSTSQGTGSTNDYGTAIVVDQTNNDLYLKANQTWRADPSLEGTIPTYHNINFATGANFYPKGYYTNNTNGVGIVLNATNDVTIGTGGSINATGTGYAGGTAGGAGSGPGAGSGNAACTAGGGGAAHSGVGSSATSGGAGGSTSYGSMTAPITLGSGAGSGGSLGTCSSGGNGGGAIKITAGGTMTIGSAITANGAGGGTGGGGAGGSIYLTAGTFAGAANVQANGVGSGGSGGGGGGGRVAMYYSTANNWTGTISASTGNGTEYGTAIIVDSTNNDLYINTNQTWDANPSLEGSTYSYHTITTASSITWTLKGYYTNNTNGVGFYFKTSQDFTIGSSATLFLDGKGYGGAGLSSSTGSGSGGGTSYCSGNGGGGGYGSTGGTGASSGGAGGSPYGSSTAPTDLGSGGGAAGSASTCTATGGAGGGAIRITAQGTFTSGVSSTITANGVSGSTGTSGAGAGGSIYIVAGTFAGSGTIRANGGTPGGGGGGGSGGRISIYYVSANTFSGTKTANAGTGGTGAGAGTNNINQTYAPTIASLAQYQTDCTTSITVGGNLESTTGCFKSTLSDTDNPDTLYMETEVKPLGTSFDGTSTTISSGVSFSGSNVTGSTSISGFSFGTQYHWRARAIDSRDLTSSWTSFGNNTESDPDFVAALQPPTNVTNTYVSDTAITVTWTDNTTTEDGFYIERSDNDASYTRVGTVVANTTSFADNSSNDPTHLISANHKYQYRIQAYQGVITSTYGTAANPTYTTPSAPSGASITQSGVGSITISWTDNSAYESAFEVQRKIGSGSFTSITTSVATNTTSYIDTNVQQNASYTYQVRAIRTSPDALNSAFSTSSALPISVGDGKGIFLGSDGRLIMENNVNNTVDIWKRVQADTTNQVGTDLTYSSTVPSNGPNLPTGATLNNLSAKEGVSTVDGKSDVIYVSTSLGAVAIHENATTPSKGAVKYYTKDAISELMYGDTRAMWPLESSLGSGLSGMSNHAQTLTNNGGVTFTSGVRGHGASFNGTSQYLSIADNSNLSVTGNITFGGWFKTTSTSTSQMIMSKNGSYTLSLTASGKVQGTIVGATTGTITSNTTIDTNWHQAVLSYNATAQTMSLYIDGRLDSSSPSGTVPLSITDSANAFTIGSDNGSTFFSGVIDEVFVSAEALTAGQINPMFQTGLRSLQVHTANVITGVGADSYQKLLGGGSSASTVNNVTDVKVDDGNQYMYVGTNDSSTNTGGLTIIGVHSDSVVDLYDSVNNTNKKDNNNNQYSGNDIVAIGLAGIPNPSYNNSTDYPSFGGTVAIYGTNDTATRLWIENQSYSLNQVLGTSTGSNLALAGTNGFTIGASLTDDLNSNGEPSYTPAFNISSQGVVNQNYLGLDTDVTAVGYTDSTLTTGTTVGISSSALTTGSAMSVTSSSTVFTGKLGAYSITGGSSVTGTGVDITSNAGGANNKGLNISKTGATTGTDYGAYINSTGASTTNVGLYVSATGGTNNYAALFNGGLVGIGNATPNSLLDISGAVAGKSLININYTGSDQKIFTASSSGVLQFAIGNTGNITSATGANWKPTADSTTALNISNSSGTSLVSFDTTNTLVNFAATASSSANIRYTGTTTTIGQLNGGAINWQTSVGGDTGLATVMTLTNGGALGIGSTPATGMKLDVAGNVNLSNVTSNTIFYGTNGTAAPGANSVGEKIQLYGTAGTVGSGDYAIGIESSNMWFNTGSGFKWYVSSANKMTMDSSGRLIIGNTSGSEKLEVYNGNAMLNQGHLKFTQNAAPGAPSVAVGASTGITGTYSYKVTFVTAQGETQAGTVSGNVTVSNQKINVTSIPTGTANVVTARKLYRIANGGTVYKLVTTLNDNTTTSYTDSTADGSLGANAPTSNTTAGGIYVGGTNMVQIDQNGNVGINTTSPNFKLDVQDSQASTTSAMITNNNTGTTATGLGVKLGFTGTGSSGNYFMTFLNGLGNIQGKIQSNGANGITYATAGIDFAEYFKKSNASEEFVAGDVVCLNTDGGVTKCTTNSQSSNNVLGIVSAHPAFAGGSQHENDPAYVLVALTGQLEVNVSNENGDINAADPLTPSTLLGVAKKATTGSPIFARALSSFSCDPGQQCQGTVMAVVSLNWFNNQGQVMGVSTGPLPPQQTTLSATTDPTTLTKLLVSGDTNLNNVSIMGTMTVGNMTVNGFDKTNGVDGASINTIVSPLRLQSTALAPIELENSAVVINTHGDMTLSAGDIVIQKGKIVGNDAIRGVATTSAGLTSIVVQQTWDKAPVSVTATASFDSYVWVDSITTSGFTIHIKTPSQAQQKVFWNALW